MVVTEGLVVLRLLALVGDEHRDRHAGGQAFEDAGNELGSVGFLASRRYLALSGPPTSELGDEIVFRERNPWGAAVDDDAERRAVRLPE